MVGPLLSWRKPDGNRRHDLSLIYSPKKIGKSTLTSSIAAWWAIDKPEQQIYLIASKVEQGRILFDMLRQFANHPAIHKRWHIRDHVSEIRDKVSGSRIKVLSCNPSGISGMGIDLLIADEFSEWPGHAAQKIWDRLVYGDAAKKSGGLKIIITTPSHEQGQHPGYKFWNDAKRIVSGENSEDISTHACVYGADESDDWEQESTWLKAGPHVNKLVSLDYYRTQYKRAKGQPDKEIAFRIYLLGQYVSNKSQYFSTVEWAACRQHFDEQELHNMPACIGLDYGGNGCDILSWVVIVKRDDQLYLLPRSAMTRKAINRKIKVGQTSYLTWTNDEKMLVSEDDTISIDQLTQWLDEDYENFDIKCLSYDPYGLAELQTNFEKQHRLVINTPPWPKTIGPLVLQLERHIKEKTIIHNNDPILNWSIQNVQIKETSSGINTTKLDQKHKIDAAQATIIGLNGVPEIDAPTWGDLPPVLSI